MVDEKPKLVEEQHQGLLLHLLSWTHIPLAHLDLERRQETFDNSVYKLLPFWLDWYIPHDCISFII